MAELKKGDVYKHEEERVCTYTDKSTWQYWAGDQRLKCWYPHPHRVWEVVAEVTNDRGEFGMPTIGGGIAAPLAVEPTTDDAKYIAEVLPEIMAQFYRKNTQYARAQTGHDLGLKGIIPDINRKSSALVTRIWDASNMYEAGMDSTEELIDDLIGHLLLMRAKLRDS